MEGTASFFSENTSIPFILASDDDGFAVVQDNVLAVRFGLESLSILVEREVVDSRGKIVGTMFQKPTQFAMTREWRVLPGKYRVLGEERKHLSQPSTVTPGTAASVVQDMDVLKIKLEQGCSSQIFELSESSEEEFSEVPAPSCTDPVLEPDIQIISNVVPLLKGLSMVPGCKSELRAVDYNSIGTTGVQFLPSRFDGDVLFELPPPTHCGGLAGLMQGMDKKHDGHPWCKTKTTNIKNDMHLTFRRSVCVGHMRCINEDCKFWHENSSFNEIHWEGVPLNPPVPGVAIPPVGSILCRHCKEVPICVATCPARMYYVTHRNKTLTRACLHLGSHSHPVSEGDCRETIQTVKGLVRDAFKCRPQAKTSAIALTASKEFLGMELLRHGDDDGVNHLEGQTLSIVLDKFFGLSSPNIRNQVNALRFESNSRGFIDNIFELKRRSLYDYIQDSAFPGQGCSKVYLFKMSTAGEGSGVDLVRRMQPGGDLGGAWIMFDHAKRVKKWTTLGVHVYDPIYSRVMTIAICDMQSEDADAQVVMWEALIRVMSKHGVPDPNFTGFMVDSAQANFNAIRRIFGSGDPSVPMENRERTCLLHWRKSFDLHNKRHIKSQFQDDHRRLCLQYKDATTVEEADSLYQIIRAWWLSSGAAAEEDVHPLNDWLAFWHFRYRQFGNFLRQDMSLDEESEMPSCNLSETMHNVWLQQSGKKGTDLYVATCDDLVRALMQQTKYHDYLKGKMSGKGPDRQELRLRAASRSGDPVKIAEAVGSCTSGSSLHSRNPHLEGEERFGSQKRKYGTPVGSANDSHRPDKVNFSIPLVAPTVSHDIHQVDGLLASLFHTAVPVTVGVCQTEIVESACDDAVWHIERTKPGSKVQCTAIRSKTYVKCTNKIAKSSHGTAAPTYSGMHLPFNSKEAKLHKFWFCSDDIHRCVRGTLRQYVLHRPCNPEIWPIKCGTNLTVTEVAGLEEAGFRLQRREKLPPRGLFQARANPSSSPSSSARPEEADQHPTKRDGKAVRRSAPTVDHDCKWETARSMEARVTKVRDVPAPGIGRVYSLATTGSVLMDRVYEVTVGVYPGCNCPDFLTMESQSIGKRGKWVPCKHLYWVFDRRMCCDPKHDLFIHQPTLAYSEVSTLLQRDPGGTTI